MSRTPREALAARHAPLVASIARRFLGRGAEYDDLFQLGMIGLLKAIDGFDEGFGTQLSTYAVPMIMGEIRRYLRDNGTVKVSRTIREKAALVARARAELEQADGCTPGIQALAAATGLEIEEIAQCDGALQAVLSLDAPLAEEGEGSLLDLQADPHREEQMLEHIALREAIGRLEPLEQRLIALRYDHDLTQQKTAAVLGLTQVKVSRMEKKIMARLRTLLQ